MYELLKMAPSEGALSFVAPLWLNPTLLKAVSDLDQVEASYLCCYKGDVLKAVMPLYEKKSLGIKRVVAPLGSYYQGVWWQETQAQATARVLLDRLNICSELANFLKSHYKRINCNLHPHNTDVRGFTWNQLKAVPLYTFVHDLAEPVSLLKDERIKQKRAQERGYEFVEKFEPELFVDRLKDLYQRKQHSSGLNYTRLKNWLGTLHQAGLLHQFNLMREGRIASSNILLSADGELAYSVMRTTAPEEMKNGASTLHSLMLVESLKQRYHKIDFCGGNQPEVARFKAALGFELKIFFQLHS